GEGVYFAGPWEKPDEARIRALNLGFQIRLLERGDDLWVELEKAVTANRPIVLFNWTPNWVESVFPGEFVEFPDYHPDCETDPTWGQNPDFSYDCGNPKNGWLKKAAWSGMEEQWPCAWQILKAMNMDNAHIAKAAALVDVDGLSVQEAAERWLELHQPLWTGWIGEECRGE
ncbi:MAG: glycine betaine ABC transporter substrate-binding protein, partial [Oleiphilaceae bacterium]|nr:glycine betaine ABC transporter substrate-binding protein [Oleiphilaceae bacterium]